jgi:hypothetical protein
MARVKYGTRIRFILCCLLHEKRVKTAHPIAAMQRHLIETGTDLFLQKRKADRAEGTARNAGTGEAVTKMTRQNGHPSTDSCSKNMLQT